jgi:shikimate dehydrogenase
LRKFGLIGYPLSHSFSQGFFTEKFLTENITDAVYQNYPIETLAAFNLLWAENNELQGLNVTIPYKKAVIPFLDKPSTVVQAIAACNCIRKFNGAYYGYNTDVIGFEKSLLPFLKPHHTKALVLGTGGASAAVVWILKKLQIKYLIVSRISSHNTINYQDLTEAIVGEHKLIINTSPVGMYPNLDQAPEIPYEAINAEHHLYDLIYNPAETLFLKKGAAQGASTQNGLAMLHIQAEESWKIWNAPMPITQ